jgi:hypothetical protein
MKILHSYLSSMNTNSILKFLSAISLLVMSFGVMLSAYLQQVYTETISFFVRDGWCDVRSQGIGVHCFGDYYVPLSVAGDPNPWSNDFNLAYTPLNFSYFRFLKFSVVEHMGSHAALFINILMTLICISIPGIYIWKNQQRFPDISGPWVLLLSLVSGPSIMLIDRGSSSFLLFPLVFFFYTAIIENKYSQATNMLLIMTLWKPQTFLLAMGVLLFFGIKRFMQSSILIVLAFSASFLLYPVNMFNNLVTWIGNSVAYQNYVEIPTLGNYSFVNFFGFFSSGLKILTGQANTLREAYRPSLSPSFVSLFCLLFAITVIGLNLHNRKRISKNLFILTSSVFLLTIPGTSFGYYLTLMLLPLFTIPFTGNFNVERDAKYRLPWILYFLMLVAMVPAWPLNWSNIPVKVPLFFETIGVHWILVHISSSLLVTISLIKLVQMSLQSWSIKEDVSNKRSRCK